MKTPHTYELIDGGKAVKCLRCGYVSYNPHDIELLYCGHCHQFHALVREAMRHEKHLRRMIVVDAAGVTVTAAAAGAMISYGLYLGLVLVALAVVWHHGLKQDVQSLSKLRQEFNL